MSKTDSTGLQTSGTNGTDPRDRNVLLGIDNEGLHHVHKTHVEAIVVVDPENKKIVHREQLDDELRNLGHHIDVDGWMDAIDEESGWDEAWYGEHAGGLLGGISGILGGEQ